MKLDKNQQIVLGAIVIVLGIFVFTRYFNKPTVEIVDDVISGVEIEGDTGDTINNDIDDTYGDISGLKEINKAEYDRLMILGSESYNEKRYSEALSYYKKALTIQELDVVYGKMYLIYTATEDYDNAFMVLKKARELNSAFNQYWFWTIELERSVHNASYDQLYKIYQEAYDKVYITSKVNLVTFFARVSEEMGEISKAIEIWNQAIKINPKNTTLYQGEIDRLNKKL